MRREIAIADLDEWGLAVLYLCFDLDRIRHLHYCYWWHPGNLDSNTRLLIDLDYPILHPYPSRGRGHDRTFRAFDGQVIDSSLDPSPSVQVADDPHSLVDFGSSPLHQFHQIHRAHQVPERDQNVDTHRPSTQAEIDLHYRPSYLFVGSSMVSHDRNSGSYQVAVAPPPYLARVGTVVVEVGVDVDSAVYPVPVDQG